MMIEAFSRKKGPLANIAFTDGCGNDTDTSETLRGG